MVVNRTVNGVGPMPRTLEERIALAQDEGLEPNLRRQLRFSGVRGVVELQAVGVRRNAEDSYERVKAAHATSSAMAVKLAMEADGWRAQGVYIIGSRLREGVESRRGPDAWHELGKRGGTTDNDIAARRILPFDFDVQRPANITATDLQMELSIAVAMKAWDYLGPIVGEASLALVHSGNGRQIHVALDDITEAPDLKLLVCSILAGVDALMSTSDVHVDLKMADAKRLVPLAGSIKKKGAAGIAERPHRRTAIVISAEPKNVTLDGLWELHARIRSDCSEAGRAAMDKAKGIKAKPGPGPVKASAAPRADDDGPYGRANAVDPMAVAEWLDLCESGSLRCPNCGESAGVDVLDHGLKCQHARCDGMGRKGFRTNVDLTMEVRGVDPRAAVNLLAEKFGFEGLPEPKVPAEKDGTPYTEYKATEPRPEPEPKASAFRIWTPEEIFAPLPDQPFAVAGLFVKGSLGLVVALGESLKTWMAVDAVMATATGGKWLGRFECTQGSALFIDYEAGDYEWRRRALRLAAGRELVLPVQGMSLVSMPPFPMTSEEFFREFETLATTYSLIAIDSLAGGSGGADENDARFAAVLYRLKSIAARTGCVVLLLHHARKSTPNANGKSEQDPREMVRGSSAIFNAVDVVLYLTRDGEDLFRVKQTKARGAKKNEPFTVRVDDVGADATIVRSADVNENAESEDATAETFNVVCGKVVRLVAHDRDLRSASEIYRRTKGTKKVVLEAVKELEERGTIVKAAGVYRLASEVQA